MKALNVLFLILVIVGAINWGCIGLFGTDVVGSILGGTDSVVSRIVYTIVGIAGLWAFSFFGKVDEKTEEAAS